MLTLLSLLGISQSLLYKQRKFPILSIYMLSLLPLLTLLGICQCLCLKRKEICFWKKSNVTSLVNGTSVCVQELGTSFNSLLLWLQEGCKLYKKKCIKYTENFHWLNCCSDFVRKCNVYPKDGLELKTKSGFPRSPGNQT